MGTAFDVSAKRALRKRFFVEHIESSETQPGAPNLYFCNDLTQIVFSDPSALLSNSGVNGHLEDPLSAEYIGGLEDQLQDLNWRMKRVLSQTREAVHDGTSGSVSERVLIHGFEGTGKSLLLNQMARASFRKVVRLQRSALNAGTTAKNQAKIEELFGHARADQPSLILM